MPDEADKLPEIDFHPPFIPSMFDLQYMIMPAIGRYCGSIFFAHDPKAQSPVIIADNGSYGLVDTGSMKLLVTCRHVWEGFQSYREKDPQVQIFVCPYPGESFFSLGSIQPIDEDRELDLATFNIEPFIEQLDESEFCPLYRSSLPRVKKLDALAFIGFPGRVDASTSLGVRFNRVPFITFVYDTTPRQIMSDMSRMFSYSKETGEKVPPKGRRGISGSPCYVVRPNNSVELVGFATEESQLKTLRFSLASFIQPDGMIKKP